MSMCQMNIENFDIVNGPKFSESRGEILLKHKLTKNRIRIHYVSRCSVYSAVLSQWTSDGWQYVIDSNDLGKEVIRYHSSDEEKQLDFKKFIEDFTEIYHRLWS